YGYNRSYFDNPQDFNRVNLVGKYTKRIGDNRLFSITANAFRSSWSASGQIPERAVTEGIIDRFGELDHEGGKTSRYQLNLQYTQSLSKNATFKTNLYAGYYDFSLYSDFTFFLIDPIHGDEIHQAESRIYAGYNASYSLRHKIGKLEAKTEIGIGFRNDDTYNSELSHTENTVFLNSIRLGDIHETNPFAYAQESVHLLPQLVATLGTRYDYFIQTYDNKIPTTEELPKATYNNGVFSPKAGLYYNFGKTGRVYANYGIGFHSNDARDIYFRPESGGEVLPLEFALDLGVVIKPVPSLLIQFAVFNMTLQQEYTYSGDAGDVPSLNGKTRRMGVDFSGRYALTKWMYLDADLNYTHARYVDKPEGQNYVELAPSFTSIGGITIKPFKDFSAGLRYRLMADRPANTENTVIAPGYNVIDFTANYSRPRYELGFQIQNLTNTKWNEAAVDTETRLKNETAPVDELCFTPGTPFFMKLSATWKF
ncbi:MAG: TonB-dependent receptor, partial [Chitinophagaceae bacterium]